MCVCLIHALHEREMPVGLVFIKFFPLFFVRADALIISHEQTFAHNFVRYNIYIKRNVFIFSRSDFYSIPYTLNFCLWFFEHRFELRKIKKKKKMAKLG